MKCNSFELALLSDNPCTIEGRLNYKKSYHGTYLNQGVFKERWFRLIKNCLFYFKISEMGKFDTKNPAGVFVLENSAIQMEHGQSISFAFSISFIDEPEKRHIFSARSEENVVQWVSKLRMCSYEYLRSRLHTLQSRIYALTGEDPLLLVPRNDGAKLWAPSVPFCTASACTTNGSSFSCHLHTNGAFTLERSKSAILASHTETKVVKLNPEFNSSCKEVYSTDKSKTSAFFVPSQVSAEDAINHQPKFLRTAPSPPMRKKSPKQDRSMDSSDNSMSELSKYLATTSIMNDPPVPPKRKLSPKHNISSPDNNLGESREVKQEEDLIKF